MKRKNTISIIAAALAICVAAVLLFGSQKECCLCNSPCYSVPCLIDLESGDIMELRLDGPTISGPEGQTDVSTFSFIQFHTVTGTKHTVPNILELKISAEEKVETLALCNKCRELFPKGYEDRYVLVNPKNKALFLIAAGEITIYDHKITMTKDETGITIIAAIHN